MATSDHRIIEKFSGESKPDDRVRAMILLSQAALLHVIEMKLAKEVCDTLSTSFETKSVINMLYLINISQVKYE